MNKHERIRAVLERREPDRIPTVSCMDIQKFTYDALELPSPKNIYRFLIHPFWSRVIDKAAPLINKFGNFEKDIMEFMDKKIAADIKMGFDSVWSIYADIWKLKDSRHMYDIWGRFYKIVDDGFGNMDTPAYIEGMFSTPEDWISWDKTDWERHPEKLFKYNKFIKDKYGDEIYIFGSHLFGLFEQAWQPFGFQNFTRIYSKEPAFMEEVIEYNKNWYLKCIDASADAGLEAVIYSDDMAYKNGPMMNPRAIDKLFGNAFKEITAHAKKRGLKIIIHTDGYTLPLLKYFVEWGFLGQHSLEPNANVDLADFREEIGNELIFLGHLDILHVLSFGTKEEVFEHVKEAIEKGTRKNGGLILGPCNSITTIAVQNIKWMVEAVKQYGGYPINVHPCGRVATG